MVLANPEIEVQVVLEIPPVLTPVAAQLWDALQYLKADRSHWCRKTSADGHGGFCAVGLIQRAPDNIHVGPGSIQDAMGFLNHVARQRGAYLDVIVYNDRPTRTHEDMIRVFEEAVALAIEEGK